LAHPQPAGAEGSQAVKLWRHVRLTVDSGTRRHYQTLLSAREKKGKKKNKVRTLMAQTASDLWMSMGGDKSILRKKMSD